MGKPKVLLMNTSTSDRLEDIPLPAQQQLGIFNETIDKDARSGNGLRDRLDFEDVAGADYQQPDTTTGGTQLREVTYHLGREISPNTVEETHGNATIARQAGSADAPPTNQHEEPGTNERHATQLGRNPEDIAVLADSGAGGATVSSGTRVENIDQPASDPGATSRTNDQLDGSAGADDLTKQVPTGGVQAVMRWVGDDKERARAALEVENDKSDPRSTLISQLNDKL